VVRRVEEFARGHGLEVVESSAAKRRVVLAGPAAAFAAALGVRLERFEKERRQYRREVGPIHLPADIAPHVEAVLGLSDEPQAAPR
jgi:kumamolisin